MERTVTRGQLRHYAARRSLFRPGSLGEAVAAMQFVQADPIRAPARAQDLTLRHRVRGYRAGDLERHFASLGIEEDRFVNYGFVTPALYGLMHPRKPARRPRWEDEAPGVGERVLEFVRGNGPTLSRDLEAVFGKQSTISGWGQSAQLTTRVMDTLHYRGHLRVVRRENGSKVYEAVEQNAAEHELSDEERARQLVHIVVRLYAPVAARTLSQLVYLMQSGGPQLYPVAKRMLSRMLNEEFATSTVEGIRYAWPLDEEVDGDAPAKVRFLAPFDPVAWDRMRFEHLHEWEYRFEAYTPAPKRLRGYYSLPLLWRERVIGWGNFSVKDGELVSDIGFVGREPAGVAYRRELEAELRRFRDFLGLAR